MGLLEDSRAFGYPLNNQKSTTMVIQAALDRISSSFIPLTHVFFSIPILFLMRILRDMRILSACGVLVHLVCRS